MNGKASVKATRSMSVMLVEDSKPVRRRLRALLVEIPGLSVVAEAGTAAEAVRLFDTHRPETVVLDLSLPDGNGMDVLRHVRGGKGECVVMVLSNHLEPEIRRHCGELGADFVFGKVTEFEKAVETLRALFLPASDGGHSLQADRQVCRTKLRVTSPIGLHARPAAMFVKLAQSFSSDIEVSFEDKTANGKSIMSLLVLCAGYGDELTVSAAGKDAGRAIADITRLFASGFREARAPAGGAVAKGKPVGAAGTILVADDEDAVRHVVMRILECNGYRTVAAKNGAEALALLTAGGDAIQAVVLDMMMPVMNGYEALRSIRRMNPRLPVITMSGSVESPPEAESAATTFLRKPFGHEELMGAMRLLLSQSQGVSA